MPGGGQGMPPQYGMQHGMPGMGLPHMGAGSSGMPQGMMPQGMPQGMHHGMTGMPPGAGQNPMLQSIEYQVTIVAGETYTESHT
jgi:hypothetical protein